MENRIHSVKNTTEKNFSANKNVFYIKTGKANFKQQLLNNNYSSADLLNKFSRPFSYDDNGGSYNGL